MDKVFPGQTELKIGARFTNVLVTWILLDVKKAKLLSVATNHGTADLHLVTPTKPKGKADAQSSNNAARPVQTVDRQFICNNQCAKYHREIYNMKADNVQGSYY